jgi:nucleoid DNA-binding protein
VTKSGLVDLVASRADREMWRAADAIDAVIDSETRSVNADNRIPNFGFGTFNPTSRATRASHKQPTGTPVNIAASQGAFAPGAAFKSLLNSKGGAASTAARQGSSDREGRQGGEQVVREDSK